jgi:hypothetical protein
MKKLLFLLLLAASANIYSQRVVQIYRNDSIIQDMSVSDVDSIIFVTDTILLIASGTTGDCVWTITGIVDMERLWNNRKYK